MLSINSIQRRTVTTCLNTDQVMFSLLEYSSTLHRERRQKRNGKLEYEYFRLQNFDVLESYLWERENHLLFEKPTSMLMVNVP
jgi:hypothetical protein